MGKRKLGVSLFSRYDALMDFDTALPVGWFIWYLYVAVRMFPKSGLFWAVVGGAFVALYLPIVAAMDSVIGFVKRLASVNGEV